MPAAICHMLCGQKSITISGCDYLRTVIKNNPNAFNVGCEGPDPFMYYSMLPWDKHPDAPRLRSYSDAIHYGLPTDFFRVILKEAKESKDEAKIAYAAGFITHHALDSTAHPYIYYETGCKAQRAGKPHQIFEKQLDYAMLVEFGLTDKEFKTPKKLKLTEKQLASISDLTAKGLKEAFGKETNANEVQYAYVGLYKGESVLFDPNRTKKWLIYLAADLAKKRDLAESMMTPNFYDEQLDVLNKRGEAWYEPTDENIKRTENFLQLFDIACQKTANRLEAFENYLNGKEELESVLEVIGNGSYENGTVDKKMYFYKKDQK